MTNLECNVKNCYYNKSSKCCRDGINVEGQDATVIDATYCGDFKEKTEGTTAQACHCSAGPEDTLDVSCEAKNCVFNDNSKCHADKITISGNGAKHESQTECGSFECGCKQNQLIFLQLCKHIRKNRVVECKYIDYTDCYVLRTATIHHQIRISQSKSFAFMLIWNTVIKKVIKNC